MISRLKDAREKINEKVQVVPIDWTNIETKYKKKTRLWIFFVSENKYTCTGMIFFEHTMPPTNVCLTVKTKRKGKKRLYRVSLPTCLIELVTNYILSFPFSLWIIILKIKRESENPHDEQILTACWLNLIS
jgi:hypothetical protein